MVFRGIIIYIQLITDKSYSIIFDLKKKITDIDEYNNLDDLLEGHIYIKEDIQFTRYDCPRYYKNIDKYTIIQDIVKWIDECLEEDKSN